MRVVIGFIILCLSLVLGYWAWPDFVRLENSWNLSSIHKDPIEKIVELDCKKILENGMMPRLEAGIFKLEIEMNSQGKEIQKIAKSYQKLFPTSKNGKNILKISLVQNTPRVMVLMSLENRETKNRYWELGRNLDLERK